MMAFVYGVSQGIFSILVLILLCMPTMVVQSIYSVEHLGQGGGRTRPECMMGGIYNSQGNASIHGKGGKTQYLPLTLKFDLEGRIFSNNNKKNCLILDF